MKRDQTTLHRRSIRLQETDYSQPGAYFVTLVTKEKANLFGEIVSDHVCLNGLGQVIRDTWLRLPRFFTIRHDEWVIMPNHLHGVVWILDDDTSKGEAFGDITMESSRQPRPNASPLQRWPNGTQKGSLGAIVQNFKSVSTRKVNQWLDRVCKGEAFDSQDIFDLPTKKSNASPLQVWQRNYYERIIRNDKELNRIRGYIIDNPRRWQEDEEYR